MAQRDVKLVITAKDEASRAIGLISTQLGQLDRRQTAAGASGKSLGTALAETITQMAAMEKATGLVVAASDRAEAAINRQRAAVSATASELASVSQQLANAQRAINNAQTRIVDARLGGGNGDAEVAALQAAEAGARELERQEQSLTRTLSQQQGVLAEQERAFREIAASANFAESAVAQYGDEAERSGLRAALIDREAAEALDEQAAAARRVAAARAEAAQVKFNELNGVTVDPRGAQAAESANVFVESFQRQEEAVRRLQDRIDPLGAIERRLAAETKVLSKAFDSGTLDAQEYARALDQLQNEAQLAREALDRVGRGEKGKIGLFGLKPYELTNLGYQVNDLVTQIASGTSPLQAFAQQGGQILQILPRIGARLVAVFSNPYYLAAAVVFGGIALSIKEASDQAERLRKVEGLLTNTGEAAGVTAQELAAVAQEIERIGFTAEESLDLVRTFLTQGLNTAYLQDFAEAAQNYADATGTDVADAIKDMTAAFTAGYDAVSELDDRLQFLTIAERDQIRALFDSGDAAAAREKALKSYSRYAEEIADKSRGTWSTATRALNRSFSDLLETLGNTDLATGFVAALDEMVQNLTISISKIDDLTVKQIDKRIGQLEDLAKLRQSSIFGPGGDDGLFDQEARELELLRKRKQAILDQKNATGDLVDAESAAQQKREGDQLRLIEQENRLANARTAAQRIALEGEKAYQEAVETGHTQRVANARREQAIERQRREEARRAEQERKQRESQFAKDIEQGGRDQLLGTARQFVGRNENNRTDARVLSDLFKAANVQVDPKITAWCAAFVNAVLATNGLPTVNQATGGNNLASRDFLAYGSKVTTPEPGDIVILKRGGGAALGHVGFFQGFTDKGDVRVLGGNQSDGVNTQTFKKSDVLGFRRAPSTTDVAEDELFGTGKQVAMPPSLHPETGKEYRWEREFDFTMLDLGVAPTIPAERLAEIAECTGETYDYEAIEPLTFKPGQLEAELAEIGADRIDDYHDWVTIGQALHHQFGGSKHGYDLWVAISKRSDKFDPREMPGKWRSFGRSRRRPITMATIRQWILDERRADFVASFDDAFDDLPDLDETPAPTAAPISDDITELLGGEATTHDPLDKPVELPWFSLLEFTNDGAIKPHLHNVGLLVTHDPRIVGIPEFNEFTGEIVQRKPIGIKPDSRKDSAKPTMQLRPDVWRVEDVINGTLWDDSRDNDIRRVFEAPKMQGGYGIRISDRDLTAAIDTVARQNSFHPVREYLERQEWDGRSRVEGLFVEYLGAQDTPYTREIARLTLIAAVCRVFEPGHKFDFAVIIEGLQGRGKSTFVAMLARKWFAELDGDFGNTKQMIEIMQGAWILEIPELSGFNRTDVRNIKAFISRTKDKARLAYDRRARVFPRQSIFFGSTNDRKYLADPTGGRRFWPISCRVEMINFARLRDNVDQIWADPAISPARL